MLFFLACARVHTPPHTPRTEDSPTDQGVPPCTGRDCLSVCGVAMAITDPVVDAGFTDLAMPGLVSRSVGWFGDEALSVDTHSLVRRDADLTELDRVNSLPAPLEVTIAGDAAFVDGAEGISVVTLGGTPSPLTWWAPAEQRGYRTVRLAGADGERLVLWTPLGVSLVDVSDPGNPRELGCTAADLSWAWVAHVDGGRAVFGTAGGALVYDLSGTAPALMGTLPLAEEGPANLWEDLLVVWEGFRTVVLYDLSGDAPVERARVEDERRAQAQLWDPVIAGGFVFHSGLDAAWWAMDLENELALVQVDSEDPERECVVTVGGWEVSPRWHPRERYAPGDAPRGCPAVEPVSDYPTGGARDGGRVLVRHDGWRVLDVETGLQTPLGRADDQGFFAGDGFVFVHQEGQSHWTFTRTEPDGTVVDRVGSPGRVVAVAGIGEGVVAVTEAVARGDYTPEAPATERIVWRLGATGDRVDVALPAGAAPIDVVAGDRVWVFDEADQVHVVAGRKVTTCPLPGLGEGARVASSLGAFFVDDAGRVARVASDCEVTALGDPGGTLVGADDAWLYVAAAVGPGEGFVTVPALVALDPGTLEVVGRVPTTRPPLVSPGERVLIMDTALVLADRP